MPETPSRFKSIAAQSGLLYAAAIWGSTFYIVKGALASVDAVTMVGYRFLIAGGLLLIWVAVQGRDLRRGWGTSAFLALLLLLLYVPQTLGLKYTTASNSGFITGLFVAFVPFFLRTIFKRTPTLTELIASIISLFGLWTLTGGLHDVNTGDLLTLITAMAYALHLLYADRYMKRGVDPFVFSCQQFLLVGVMSLVVSAVAGRSFVVTTSAGWWVILFLAVLPTLSAFVIQMVAQKTVSPLRVTLIFALEPVFAGVFAWTLGGEEFVTRRALGGLLIFVALIVSGLPDPRRRKAAVSEPT